MDDFGPGPHRLGLMRTGMWTPEFVFEFHTTTLSSQSTASAFMDTADFHGVGLQDAIVEAFSDWLRKMNHITRKEEEVIDGNEI